MLVREALNKARQGVASKDADALRSIETDLLEAQRLLTDAVLAASEAMMNALGDEGGQPQ